MLLIRITAKESARLWEFKYSAPILSNRPGTLHTRAFSKLTAMEKSLKYISISHQTTSFNKLEYFCLNKSQEDQLHQSIKARFPDISGLMILSTCNRSEIYMESLTSSAVDLRDFFISFISNEKIQESSAFFRYSNSTDVTLHHLLYAANGLQSAVIGDAQILGQFKEAWQKTIAHNIQGSLLERAMQAVFKTHKRIINETDFHQGTQSAAYKALKLIEAEVGKNKLSTQKLLIIGAGEICQQLVKYLPKFAFQQVTIANRTPEKAVLLAKQNRLQTMSWQQIEANKLDRFDAIISAVSNRSKLITNFSKQACTKILVDLAVPSNVDPKVTEYGTIKLYNMDTIRRLIDQNESARQQSIQLVQRMISHEQDDFLNWLKKKRVRAFLSAYNRHARKISAESLSGNQPGEQQRLTEMEVLINRISDKLVKEPAVALSYSPTGNLSAQNLNDMIHIFTTQSNRL